MASPGFDPHLVELGGLRVRPFKVSGGSPRPPPEQTPVVTSKHSSSLKTKQHPTNINIIMAPSWI